MARKYGGAPPLHCRVTGVHCVGAGDGVSICRPVRAPRAEAKNREMMVARSDLMEERGGGACPVDSVMISTRYPRTELALNAGAFP